MSLPVRTSPSSLFSTLSVLVVALGIVSVTNTLSIGQVRYDFPNDDTVVYGIVSRLWAEGLLPYRDVYDFKPPLIYAFFRGCFALWGTYPQAVWEGFMWLTGIASVAILLAAQRMRLTAFGIGASLAFGLMYWTTPVGLSREQIFNTEGLASAMVAGAWACIMLFQQSGRRAWACISGIFLGLAFLSKQPALAFALPLVGHIIIAHRAECRSKGKVAILATLLMFVGGALLPSVGVIGYYATHGALSDLFFWTWQANLLYTGGRNYEIMWRAYTFLENITIFAKNLLSLRALPYLLALLTIPIYTIRNRNWLTTSVSLWLLAAILTLTPCTQSGVRHYLAFFQFPLALAAGNLCHMVWSALASRQRAGAVTAVAALCIPFAISGFELFKLQQALTTAPGQLDRSKLAALSDASKELQALAGPSKKILFEGSNLLPLFQSGLIPATKYIYAIPMSIIPPQQYAEDLIAQAQASQPLVALLTHYSPEAYAPTEPSPRGKLGEYLLQNFEPPRQFPVGTLFVRKTTQNHSEQPRP